MENEEKWADSIRGSYIKTLNGKLFMGVSSNTESINRYTRMDEDGMLLTYVINGKGTIETKEGNYEIKDGMVMFRHSLMDYRLSLSPRYHHRRCYLFLPKELFLLLLEMYPELSTIPPVFEIEYSPRHTEEFESLFKKVKETENHDFLSLLPSIERYLLHFLHSYLADSSLSYLRKAKARLEEDFSTSLPEIASSFSISYNTFRKQFTDNFGISPQRYRMKARCEQACQLLSMGLSCSRVADTLSYPDLYTFSHQFSLVTGQTPREYRREHIL